MSGDPFFTALERLVADGDYGDTGYDLPRIKTKLQYGKERYVSGPFSWEKVISTDAPALLFRGACNVVAGVRGHAQMPLHSAHLLEGMEAGSIFEVVHNGAKKAIEAGVFYPPDQCAVELPTYYTKLRFPRDQAYVWKSEYWLQVGNRESAVHVLSVGLETCTWWELW